MNLARLIEKNYELTSFTSATSTEAIDLADGTTFSAQCNITATGVSGASVKLMKSNDGVNWVDEGVSIAITTSGTIFLESTNPNSRYMRVTYAISGGSIVANNYILVKGFV